MEQNFLTLEPPTKDELQALKKALGLEKGSLKYKRCGEGIYLLTYNPESKRHDWILQGSWGQLKERIKVYEEPSICSGIVPQGLHSWWLNCLI